MWLVNPARARAPAHRAHTTPESELGRAATPLASVQAVRTLSALSNSVGPPKSVHPIHWLRRESAEGPSNLIITKTRHSRVRVFCSPSVSGLQVLKLPPDPIPVYLEVELGVLALFLRFGSVSRCFSVVGLAELFPLIAGCACFCCAVQRRARRVCFCVFLCVFVVLRCACVCVAMRRGRPAAFTSQGVWACGTRV